MGQGEGGRGFRDGPSSRGVDAAIAPANRAMFIWLHFSPYGVFRLDRCLVFKCLRFDCVAVSSRGMLAFIPQYHLNAHDALAEFAPCVEKPSLTIASEIILCSNISSGGGIGRRPHCTRSVQCQYQHRCLVRRSTAEQKLSMLLPMLDVATNYSALKYSKPARSQRIASWKSCLPSLRLAF